MRREAKRPLFVGTVILTSNQSIQKEIHPEYSLEGLMLKLKFQQFCHQMQRASSLEKTLMLGKVKGKGRRGRQRRRWLGSITDSIGMSLSKLWEIVWLQSWTQLSDFHFTLLHWEIVKDRESWCVAVHGVAELGTT